MSESTKDAVTEVTFESGYDELKGIVTRLDSEEASVHETCELFARGRGLEKELRSYLTDQQGKLDLIEAGEDLPKFRIVAPEDSAEDEVPKDERAAPEDVPTDIADFKPASPPSSATDDDIPF